MLLLEQPVRTARLTLRPFRLDDLDAFNAFDRLPSVARYLYSEPRDRAASRVVLERKIAADAIRAAGDHMSLAVDLTAGGQCIGDLLLEWTGNEHLQGEIGY